MRSSEHESMSDNYLETPAYNIPDQNTAALLSIAISLKRLADHLAPDPNSDPRMPPLLWLGDVLRETRES
jgi:hypothetical protein